MNPDDIAIIAHLQANPDTFYITPDGQKLYLLVPDQGVIVIEVLEGNLLDRNEEQLNRIIQDFFLDQM